MSPVSAHDIAAELRRRLPGIGSVKLHKLLYYCQGHHLADLGEPLFNETISAWDMGPVVGALWKAEKDGQAPPPRTALNEAELNTIGYVVSRYGALTGNDLKHLTHAETPWVRADERRPAGGRARIEPEWLAEYFRAEPTDPDDPEEIRLAPDVVAKLVEGAPATQDTPGTPDTRQALLARLQR